MSDMKKLTFVFDEDLFGAFQHGDWRKQDEIECAIKVFLSDDDIEEIRTDNGEGFDRCADFILVDFDNKNANHDDGLDEYLVLKIKDIASAKHPLDEYIFSSKPLYIAIEPGDTLVFEKHGNVAHIRLR